MGCAKEKGANIVRRHIVSSDSLAVDYFNFFMDIVVTIEAMRIFEESGEKDVGAEWKQKLGSLVKQFKTYEAYVIEKTGSFKPDEKARELDRTSREIPLCIYGNDIDFKKLGDLVAQGVRRCVDEERASSLLQRIEATIAYCISESISPID